MKRRIISALLISAMVMTLAAGCGTESSYWQQFIQGIVLFLAVSADFFRTFFAERKKY